jgi:signal transduction histidine kinase
MKLTKKQEIEIWQVYDTWLYSYLNGDVKTYNKYLDKDYHFIGSTDNEEFLNKKDTTNFFKATADQLAGKCDLRNETKIIEKFEELVFITHLFDAWFKTGEDLAYYGRFRFTNTLKKNKEGWRFIYQHFSTTDSKTDEGETIGFDKVSAENQELREAIKRRTFELEQKNRELEVETALERIRAQAVAMKESSDLLDIVVSMRNEFIKLGHEAHYFWHMMWLPKTYEKAMTSGDGSKIGFVMELPRHIHGDIPLLAKWEKSKKPTVVYTMNVEEAIDYVDKMVALGNFKNIDPQAPSHDDIRHIGGLTFIMARTTHGEIGYSLPGIVNKPPKEDVDILVKLASAFDLAHQRFLDLQKAEKQARETQIELSLERIRSRVTAMQESSDLFDIVVTMRNEFLSLGHEADYFWHMKWTEDYYEMSMTAEDGGRLGMVITVPKFVHEQIESLYQWEKSKSPYFVLALNGKEAWDYIEKMNTYGKYQLVDPNAPSEEDILHIGGLTFIIARTTHGEIGFSLAGKVDHPPKASIDILIRFASVFDLAYKRFEDLKKAEAQARETQIELALEKVRSRTMAMQHSDELQEASYLLDQQVRALGIKTWGCAFNIFGDKDSTEWFGNEKGVLPTYSVPRKGIFKEYYQKGQKGESFFIKEFSGKTCVDHYEYMSSLPVIGDVLKNLKKTNNGFPSYQIDHVAYFKYGYLLFITKEHVPDAHVVFQRFAKVFEQTYTRFLDLQKAEEQAKEAQIETALERVRSRSMAMHKSEELLDVITVVSEQLIALGFKFNHVSFANNNIDETYKFWTSAYGFTQPMRFVVPYIDIPMFNNIKSAQKRSASFFADILTQKEHKEWHEHLLKNDDRAKVFSKENNEYITSKGMARSIAINPNIMLILANYASTPYTEEENRIIERFGQVFEQSYTRFLDLKRAETQARESQIETALERVRSRSMAMHNSEELKEVIQVLYDQFIHLNINIEHAGFILDYKENDDMHIWLADHNAVFPKIVLPYFDCAHWNSFIEAKRTGQNFFSNTLDFKEKNKFYKDLFEHIPDLPEETKKTYFGFKGLAISTVLLDNVGLYIENYSGTPFSDEDNKILMRFGKVFQQTYTRFLDLQKAEAQAREAQIETALEKVRSASMAMHKTNELAKVVSVLFEQFSELKLDFYQVWINIFILEEGFSNCWFSPVRGVINEPYTVRVPLEPFEESSIKSWREGKEFSYLSWSGQKEIDEIMRYFSDITEHPSFVKIQKKTKMNRIEIVDCNHKYGVLAMAKNDEINDIDRSILKRFTNVFEQAYTRFLDLQKAERQAREAQIETALEKVRSRSLAMHNAEELKEVVLVIVEKLKELGVIMDANGITLCTYFSDSKNVLHWIASPDFSHVGKYLLPYFDHVIFKEAWQSKEQGDAYFSKAYSVKEKNSFFKHAFEHSDYKHFPEEIKQWIFNNDKHTLSFAWQKNSALLIPSNTGVLPTESEKEILIRFSKVFEQAYIRFMDLQKAEAQAREAQIETALEKVRSRTMAMQHSDELPEAANNLFLQVQALGIPAWSAGYCIWEDESKKSAWCNMSSEGEIQKGFSLPTIGEGYDFYKPLKKKQNFHVSELGGKALVKHYDFMKKLPIVGEILLEFSQKGIALPTFQIFHIVFFTHGYLMFITYEAVPNEWDIFQRFGKVFEQTYTRFLDLRKAEAQSDLIKKEKERLEVTLSELKATQSQLIQSEKMASLGELTAGIAHEIQNPLNFVNNFSEVSKELLDEMLEEIENGDMEEVKAIMDDVIQNLEKINHHGKRADGIVKGMLQHSRASGSQKEPTNINGLADEYLRLAYHGLRAKDKSFNATLETDYDDTIEKINVIPQDIGRVVLNLLTNAFYVVNEKKQSNQNGFEPTVKLSTKKNGNWVTISVKDNGNGIPQKVLDKIFQPFFTTKPTGQGTGLGLSMSYDIITKGHGGELKVNTKEREGTEFQIILPIKSLING